MCEEFDHEDRIYTLEGSIKVLKERIEKLENEQKSLLDDMDECHKWNKEISELQKYNKTFRRFINRICLEQVQTDNNRIKDISELFNILKKWGLYNDK